MRYGRQAKVDWLRTTRDAWDQEALQGVSWDLIPIFFGVAVVIVILHALYMWIAAPKRDHEND